ncbi:MAG: hypothetical protein LBU32_27240 [Clostridiales bacterium]|nr:hypothetical protein [Clostridiales bacterium]
MSNTGREPISRFAASESLLCAIAETVALPVVWFNTSAMAFISSDRSMSVVPTCTYLTPAVFSAFSS